MQKTKGFSLIELLIVLTIIVVLSSIVLVSAGKVIKDKAKDNTIKINVSSLKLAGEIYHNINSSYTDVCLSDDFQRIKTAVLPIAKSGVYNCSSRSGDWVACAALNRSSNSWCIDSKDVEIEISSSYCTQIGSGSVYTCN
ncbi:type II secretion system GspH family protein [Patescibacteria group bacterium]|nr:type II secretion system GspH family protein [Patescibacteria group bacterium]